MALRLSGGRRLQSPKGVLARPTTGRVRAAVMNMLASELPGSRWLDLCGGSGVMACEALQRGASVVVVVEKDRRVAAVARKNVRAVVAAPPHRGQLMPEVVVVEQEALRFLAQGPAATGLLPFDLIYADPPWAAGLHRPLAEAVLAGGWLSQGGTMVLECALGTVQSAPKGWRERRRRTYGSTEVVLLEQEGSQPLLTAEQG